MGLIWFTGVTLPLLFFAFALAVDINSMVVAQGEVSNLAYAAAIAGAHQAIANPSPSNGMIDPSLGPAAALATVQDGVTAGAVDGASGLMANVSLTNYGGYSNDEITVTIQYQVPNLVVLGYLLGNGTTTATGLSVARTGFVCVPGDATLPTGGYCVTSANQ